jgi:hypothetical protein
MVLNSHYMESLLLHDHPLYGIYLYHTNGCDRLG